MKKDKNLSEHDLIIKFDNAAAAKHFAEWLCGQGEQDYWEWMKCREQEEDGDITATYFGYHGEEDESKDTTDPSRYGKFIEDGIIRTKTGRLT